MTVRTPGKINLYLAVGDLLESGYHELTTVFHAVSLVDEVTVRNADVLSLEISGEGADQLPLDERNLAWQAAELMAEHVGRAPDVSIPIDKCIPVAGGMGGGSADAAAVLVALNSLWELGVPRRDLHALAAKLGSDVPFALHGGTALGTGRGEELATVLARNTFHWVLAFAEGGLSTPAVFGELDRLREVGTPPRLEEAEPVVAALAAGDPEQLAPLLGNELQPAALSMNSALRRVLRAGVEAGALAGIVSGSGPTCTFLCRSAPSAVDVGTELSGAGVCRTVRVASGPVHGARVVPSRPGAPTCEFRPTVWQFSKRSLRYPTVMITGQATSLVLPPAVPTGGRVLSHVATLRADIASPSIRDEIAAQLWARGYPNVWLSRSNIKCWAMAPEPRRQS